jgi:hypothetical protein
MRHDLHDAVIDVEGPPPCGQTALSALTGRPLSEFTTTCRDVGTTAYDLDRCLEPFGLKLHSVNWFDEGVGPTLAEFASCRDRLLVLVTDPNREEGRQQHWAAVCDELSADAVTMGRWMPALSSPHANLKVLAAWRVEPR